MTDNNITYEYIPRYLAELLPSPNKRLARIAEMAERDGFPIARPEVINFITTIIRLVQGKRILEVGTAIGYSAAAICMAAGKGARIVTIEHKEESAKIARENLRGLNAEVLVGESVALLSELEGEYDVVFLDAAKGQYLNMLGDCLRLLRVGGLLISDNVLYKGMVATDDLRERRQITIIKRMRAYLEAISSHPCLTTSVIPIGDGVSISVKGTGGGAEYD